MNQSDESDLPSRQISKDVIEGLSLPFPALVLIVIVIVIVSQLRLFVPLDLRLLFRLRLPGPYQAVRVRGIQFHVAAPPRERRDSVPHVPPPGSASTGRLSDAGRRHPQSSEQRALEEVEHQELLFVRVQHDLGARDVSRWK